MRILHWYTNLLGGGAISRSVQLLAQAQAQAGAQVAIAAAHPHREALYQPVYIPPEVQLLEWKPARIHKLGGLVLRVPSRESIAQIRSFQPDLVHAHGEFSPDNYWATRLFDCPAVLSPHGAFHPQVLQKGHHLGKVLYIKTARRLVYGRFSGFHALCPAEKSHISQLITGIPVYCVPQGPGFLPDIRSTSSRSSQANDHTMTILWIGRLDVFTKGLDLLLDAFAKALQFPGARKMQLVLVGPDWQGGLSRLQAQAENLGITPHVRFAGTADRQQVNQFLAEADLYIQLSRHEGFSLTVAEALCAGKPVIISEGNGLASYPEIKDFPHILIVPPDAAVAAHAIRVFVEQATELERLASQHSNDLLKFFSWDGAARKHLRAYRQFIPWPHLHQDITYAE